MPVNTEYIYWDSCIFLAYIKAEPGRIDTLNSIWRKVEETPTLKIVTSTIAVVEVAFGEQESLNGRTPQQLSWQQQAHIDALWQDDSILTIELIEEIARMARQLMHQAKLDGTKLKTFDATYLATAMWLDKHTNAVQEFHTYDGNLKRYNVITGLQIHEPHIEASLQQSIFDTEQQ